MSERDMFMEPEEILDEIEKIFPETPCELVYENPWQFVLAVVLSAQTTDASVNRVTPALFEKYPTMQDLARADERDVTEIIRSLGLYKRKAKNLIEISRKLVEDFNGQVPSDRKGLESLPGVGRKSASVILDNIFQVPALGVDTHVERMAKRLGFADPEDSVRTVEEKLMAAIPEKRWGKAHHDFIHFGRYFCTAKNPNCDQCPFQAFCRKEKLDTHRLEKRQKEKERRKADPERKEPADSSLARTAGHEN